VSVTIIANYFITIIVNYGYDSVARLWRKWNDDRTYWTSKQAKSGTNAPARGYLQLLMLMPVCRWWCGAGDAIAGRLFSTVVNA